MNGHEEKCSEELLSGLLDDELDPAEKRAAALHAAACPECARSLGQLFAMRAAVAVSLPRKVAVPRTLWKGVRQRLDRVDNLVRATNLTTQRRRPLVSPVLIAASVAVVAVAFVAAAILTPDRPLPLELTRLHQVASYCPNDPGLHQAIGYQVDDTWRPVSSNLTTLKGVTALQTIYDVSGLTVSVFRLPPGTFDASRLTSIRAGDRTLYLAGTDKSSMVASQSDGGWDVVVARSPMENTIGLALTCPRSFPCPQPY